MRHTGCDVLPLPAPDSSSVSCQLASPLFLLAGDRASWALPRSAVGMGSLPPGRQAASVAQSPIAPEIHHPLDVHLNLAPEVSFNHDVAVDMLAKCKHLDIGKFIDPPGLINSDSFADLDRPRMTDAMDAGQGDGNTLSCRDVYTCYPRQFAVLSALVDPQSPGPSATIRRAGSSSGIMSGAIGVSKP